MADPVGGHMRHHSNSLPKKLMFAKFAHGRTNILDGQMDTSSPLPAHFRSLPVHFRFTSGPFGHHMRHHSNSLPIKMNFAKFADGRTDIRTEKK